jgi:hypothetical protein
MNLLLDFTLMYFTSGICVIYFLYTQELFFFTQISHNNEAESSIQQIADKALSICINIGLATTAVVVWPLVLFTCMSVVVDDEQE